MQRIIGILLGGLTIYALLNIMDAFGADTQPKYLLAVVVGMLVALVWPWFISLVVARRVRAQTQGGDRPRSRGAGSSQGRLSKRIASGSTLTCEGQAVTVDDRRDTPTPAPTPVRRPGLSQTLGRPDHLGLRRSGHPARPAARRGPDPRGGRHPDGDVDRRRAPAASDPVIAGRRVAGSRPEPAPTDDRGGSRASGAHRQHPHRCT